MGRWVQHTMLSRKLLTSNLHNIFNAATILLLTQLLFDNFEQSQDTEDIQFSIECFDVEARDDNNYAIDCAGVLKDLQALVLRLKNQTLESQSHICNSHMAGMQVQLPTTTTAYDVGFILNPEIPTHILSSQHAVYTQLSGWMDHDEFQLYNDTSFMV